MYAISRKFYTYTRLNKDFAVPPNVRWMMIINKMKVKKIHQRRPRLLERLTSILSIPYICTYTFTFFLYLRLSHCKPQNAVFAQIFFFLRLLFFHASNYTTIWTNKQNYLFTSSIHILCSVYLATSAPWSTDRLYFPGAATDPLRCRVGTPRFPRRSSTSDQPECKGCSRHWLRESCIVSAASSYIHCWTAYSWKDGARAGREAAKVGCRLLRGVLKEFRLGGYIYVWYIRSWSFSPLLFADNAWRTDNIPWTRSIDCIPDTRHPRFPSEYMLLMRENLPRQ